MKTTLTLVLMTFLLPGAHARPSEHMIFQGNCDESYLAGQAQCVAGRAATDAGWFVLGAGF